MTDKLAVNEFAASMIAAQLHGPGDLRVETVPHPGPPPPGQALLRVSVTGVCGSDLHSYKDGRIGDNQVVSPLTLGHEFAGVVEAVHPDADNLAGDFQPLAPGDRVAVDPAQPCHRCEMCEQGHPNLCLNLHFCGAYPDHGSLAQWLHVPTRSCFHLPPQVDDVAAALLEPLGVALHAVNLAKLRLADSVAILGAGCIGLAILQLVKLSGAQQIFVSDKFSWRLAQAAGPGVTVINCDQVDASAAVQTATGGRGVDVAIEAAWADESVQQAADMLCVGGRLVLVGISETDTLAMRHTTARRKGLTIKLARRMKHTYPRSIQLVQHGAVDLTRLVSHYFPLAQAPQAFALNAAYADNVVKVMIKS